MAGDMGDEYQGGLLGMNPYTLATIAQLFGAKKGDNWGLAIANIESQRQAAQNRAQQAKITQVQLQQAQRQAAQQQQRDALAQRAFAQGSPNLTPNDDEGNPMPSTAGGGFPEYARGLMQIDPQAGMAMQAQLAQMNQRNVKEVAPGASLVDLATNKPVFTAPEKAPSGFTRDNLGRLQADPNWFDAQLKLRKAGATNVTVDTKQEGAFAQAFGKQQAEEYSGLMKSEVMANSKINKLSRLQSLLDQSGKTGKLAPTAMDVKAVADSLGFKVDPKLGAQQAAQALSNELALEMRNPSGGAGMPGALSDSDRQFLTNMVPNLAKTPEGNKMLIDTAKRLAQREREIGALARAYRQKTGRFDEGFYAVLSEYSASHPLFPDAAQPQAPQRLRFDAQGNEIP